MARYQIIDEPQSKPWAENLIVNPIIVLFVSIFLPLFWNPPLFGRFWMPLVWLALNGYALGSSTLRREVAYSVAGGLVMVAVFFGTGWLYTHGVLGLPADQITPFLRLVLFAVFFFTIYSVVIRQTISFELYQYIHGKTP